MAWALRLEPWRSFRNVSEAMETKVCEGSKKSGVKVGDRIRYIHGIILISVLDKVKPAFT